jgi:hypothetical protein
MEVDNLGLLHNKIVILHADGIRKTISSVCTIMESQSPTVSKVLFLHAHSRQMPNERGIDEKENDAWSAVLHLVPTMSNGIRLTLIFSLYLCGLRMVPITVQISDEIYQAGLNDHPHLTKGFWQNKG